MWCFLYSFATAIKCFHHSSSTALLVVLNVFQWRYWIMKSTISYEWNGHNIIITARASARFLWLDYTFDVVVDNRHLLTTSSWNGLCSSTHFKIPHHGKNLHGQVISSGFPGTPIVTQATILDDSIIGHSQIWIKDRYLTYIILAASLLTFVAM